MQAIGQEILGAKEHVTGTEVEIIRHWSVPGGSLRSWLIVKYVQMCTCS